MVTVIILIQVKPGATERVCAAAEKIEEVQKAYIVTGPYDVIAILEAEDVIDIGHIVTGKINTVSGISRTIVCTAQ